jgi:Tol biopolymer transport system component
MCIRRHRSRPFAAVRAIEALETRLDRRTLSCVLIMSCSLAGAAAPALAQETWRVSVDSSNGEADGDSSRPAISADGRFVVFASSATNLVSGDANGCDDIFVHDGWTGVTERVSVDSTFKEANGASGYPSISGDGRFVVFRSAATNLVAGDKNRCIDIFVRDRLNSTTALVSVDSQGHQANSTCLDPEIGPSGRLVVFQSNADNLVAGDTNRCTDIFVRDLLAGTTVRASVDSSGAESNGESYASTVSADDRFVAFRSAATNLVLGDTNGLFDVFLHDLQVGLTERESVDSSGGQADGESHHPSLSADGSLVAFYSYATNLVAGDTNGAIDVFVRDRGAGTTERVSVSSTGGEGDGDSRHPSISADGSLVAFESDATNLIPSDGNGTWDVFVHDRASGFTRLASVGANAGQGDGQSVAPSLTADGRQVAFASDSTNLVPSNLNGKTDIFVNGHPLTLEIDPPFVAAGQKLHFSTWTGAPNGACLLAVVELNGVPTFLPSIFTAFDGQGEWTTTATVPPGLSGLLLTFGTWGDIRSGRVDASNRFVVGFQ